MTKTVDFTKKIVCSDESVKVIQVLPVNYENENFKHLIVYEMENGYQDTCAVNNSGTPDLPSGAYSSNFNFLNPEPEVVYTTYRNVYHSGFIGKSWSTREEAEKKSDPDRSGVLETLKFDDGASKVNFIEV